MKVREGFGETLPGWLQRRHGVAPSITLGALAAVLIAAVAVYLLVLRDPRQGETRLVHRDRPVFNVLAAPGLVKRASARPGELMRLRARRNGLRATGVVSALRLPAYEGDVAGILPVFAENRARRVARALDGLKVTGEGRARLHGAPGYQVEFSYREGERSGVGVDTLIVPDEPGARDGVILSLRIFTPAGAPRRRGRAAAKAVRSALRSLEFGPDRL